MDSEMYHRFLRDITDIENFQDFVQENCNFQYEKQHFNPLLHLDDLEFMRKYRFSKENMQKVIEFIKDDFYDMTTDEEQLAQRRPQVPVEIQIMAAIRFWGRTEGTDKTDSFEKVLCRWNHNSNLFQHPLMTSFVHGVKFRTLSRICRRVSGALASKARIHIRMPATLSEKEAATQAFQFAKMPSVIGVVEHCNVRFQRQLEAQKISNSTLKAKEDQIHIQIISDAQCKIRDIDCKLKLFGSAMCDCANETFTQSRIKERFEQNEFRGRILLGGPGLSSLPYLLTPVECPLSHKEMSYNRAHAVTLAPAEECLNLWKQRFCLLQSTICSSFSTARNTIVALAVLHNLAVDWDDRALDCSAHNFTKSNGHPPPTSVKMEMDARSEFIKNHF